MSNTAKKSTKVFFLSQVEYNSVKNVVNLKNFTRVPGVNNEVGGFAFYSK